MFVDLKKSPQPTEDGEIPIEVSQVTYRNSFVMRIALPYPILEQIFGGKVPDLARVNVQFGFGAHHGRVRVTRAAEGEGYSLVLGSRRVPIAQIARRPEYVVNEAFQPVSATDVSVKPGEILFTLPEKALAAQGAFEGATCEA